MAKRIFPILMHSGMVEAMKQAAKQRKQSVGRILRDLASDFLAGKIQVAGPEKQWLVHQRSD